ncbi:Plasmodium exported protein (PHIST), unknown function [Plasmodium ovale wallikeri]|uniref:Plasmodium RESA N-terminal domain-containing protein n=2 Tax=Plasmodium ovale TaxID=36330 RepID=A0A1A9ATB1_PLAOA|nr:Plasmodium exported protein (PHIST), unknown function [Plasmodium ovale wallikeri]SBT59501.1 Plasmodium exported protein (PHIST), unknown function [Plasmodium ovale wallikeri]SBT72910.1 Plasmodium RESA N-terminal, putative [Plasmodium ovale]
MENTQNIHSDTIKREDSYSSTERAVESVDSVEIESVYNEEVAKSDIREGNSIQSERTMEYIEPLEEISLITLEEEYTHCDILTEQNDEMSQHDISEEDVQGFVESVESSSDENSAQPNSSSVIACERVEQLYDTNIPNFWKKLKEDRLYRNHMNACDLIDHNHMYIIYNYFHNLERKKYFVFRDDLWKICEDIAEKYNIPNEIKIKEWDAFTTYILSDLLQKDRKDYNDLYDIMKSGVCCRSKFIEFIDDKRFTWCYTTEFIFKAWTNLFTMKLISYAQ